MKQGTLPDRTRQLIREARGLTANPNSAPAIVHVMLNQMWDAIEADPDVMRHLVAAGLNPAIRDLLKLHDDGAGPARSTQIEMFPEGVRRLVEKINRDRVWVPSRGEFVELVPDAISTFEMREAGGFLIGKGRDTINRGTDLIALATALERTA